jgi:replicative DNA helicase
MEKIPQNLDAEAALIGSVIYDNSKFYVVRDLVGKECFYIAAHQYIWDAIGDLIGSNRVADAVALKAYFEKDLAGIGGAEYLLALLDCAAFGSEIEDYARMVSDAYERRELVKVAEALKRQAEDLTFRNPLDAHDQALEEIREKQNSESTLTELVDVTLDALDNRDAIMRNLLPVGYPSIDDEIGGLERGAMTVLGARPGMGKTAIAICLVGNLLRAGQTVGFFSLEMPDRDIGLRLGCWEAWQQGTGTVPYFSDIKQGRAHPETLGRVKSALRQPHLKRFFVDDRGGLKLSDMRRRMRDWKRHCRRRGLPIPSVIVVDHMGHARPDDKAVGRYEKITEVSNGLLAIAKEFDVAILALCQLNRASVQNRRRPSLEDLRDSGAIEQDASCVLLLHREDYYLEKSAREGDEEAIKNLQFEKGKAELIIAKARNGPTGAARLTHSVGHNVFRDPFWQSAERAA